MGIQGLLPFVHEATRRIHVPDEFIGCVLAIDVYCWIHRGAYACADKLALGTPTDAHAPITHLSPSPPPFLLHSSLLPLLISITSFSASPILYSLDRGIHTLLGAGTNPLGTLCMHIPFVAPNFPTYHIYSLLWPITFLDTLLTPFCCPMQVRALCNAPNV